MAATAGTAFISIKPDMTGFGRTLTSEVNRAMAPVEKSITSKLSKAGGAISSFGGTLTKGITLPLVGAAGAASLFGLRTAADLESAQVAFTTLTGSAEKGAKVMTDLKALGAITPFQTKDLTTTAQRLINAGIATEDLTGLITHLGDAAGTQGAQGLDRLGFAFSQVMGSGRAMTEDINQIADVGVPIWGELAAQMGVTQAETRKMASEGKISAETMRKAFEAPIGPMTALTGGMKAQSATLTGVWSTFTDTLGQSLADAFTPVLPEIKSSLTELSGAIGPALKAIAPVFAQILHSMIPVVSKLADMLTAFSKLSTGQQEFIVKAGLGVAALGPVLIVFGKFVSTMGNVVKGVQGLVGAAKGIATFIRVVYGIARLFGVIKIFVSIIKFMSWQVVFAIARVTVAMMTNPVILLIMAIVAAVALVAFLIWKYWDQIKAAFVWAWSFIQPILMAVWNFFVSIFNGIWQFLQVVWDAIVKVFTSAFDIIWTAIQIWFALITLPFRIWFMVVKAIIEAAWDIIVKVFNAIVDFVRPLWDGLWKAVMAVINAVWGVVKSVFQLIKDFVVKVFTTIRDTVKAVWDAVFGFIKTVVGAILDWIRPKFNAIKDFVVGVFETIRDKIKGIWDKIKSIVQGAVDAMGGIVQGMWGGLKSVLNVGVGIVNSFIRGVNKVISTINKVPGAPNIPNIPEIPRLAAGGIVTRPTTALVGEAGPEAVIPLGKIGSLLGDVRSEPQPIFLTISIGDRDITDMIESVTRTQQDQLARMLVGGRRL